MSGKGNVTSGVVTYIRKNIQNGTWKIGEKIPSENELCKTLNVSRISVRSALQQFIALDVLESIHGKGTYLKHANLTTFGTGKHEASTEESMEEIKQLLEFRSMLEPDVCAKIAPTASPELIATLSEYLVAMQESREESEAYVDMDIKYHMALCQETHNPILIGIMSDIFDKRRDAYKLLNVTTGYYGGIYYHSLLLDAFKRHDGKHARMLMKEHLERGILDVTLDNGVEQTDTNDPFPEEE